MIRPIEYTVSLEAPQTQTFQIRMLVRNVASRTLDVALPVWRQGKYAVINPAATRTQRHRGYNVRQRPLRSGRLTRPRGASIPEALRRFSSSYTVYANSLNDRTRHVDDTHAFLSGATVFMYVPNRRADPLLVRLEATCRLAGCMRSRPRTGDSRTLLAPDYDVLIDSPIEIGIHERVSFDVDGKQHDIVLWGGCSFDSDRLERDFAKVIRAEAAIFGSIPYERYRLHPPRRATAFAEGPSI